MPGARSGAKFLRMVGWVTGLEQSISKTLRRAVFFCQVTSLILMEILTLLVSTIGELGKRVGDHSHLIFESESGQLPVPVDRYRRRRSASFFTQILCKLSLNSLINQPIIKIGASLICIIPCWCIRFKIFTLPLFFTQIFSDRGWPSRRTKLIFFNG